MSDPIIDPTVGCLNANFHFPAPNLPGLPNFLLSLELSLNAGINYCLNPPFPFQLPNMSIFLSACLPSFNLGCGIGPFGCGPLSFPGIGGTPTFDTSGFANLLCVALNFTLQMFLKILINFPSLGMPSLPSLIALFLSVAVDLGISFPSLPSFANCFVTAAFNFVKAALGL